MSVVVDTVVNNSHNVSIVRRIDLIREFEERVGIAPDFNTVYVIALLYKDGEHVPRAFRN